MAQPNIQTRITISSHGEVFRRFQKQSDRRMSCDRLHRYRRGVGVMDQVVPDPDS